jgi:hypothetical protein
VVRRNISLETCPRSESEFQAYTKQKASDDARAAHADAEKVGFIFGALESTNYHLGRGQKTKTSWGFPNSMRPLSTRLLFAFALLAANDAGAKIARLPTTGC